MFSDGGRRPDPYNFWGRGHEKDHIPLGAALRACRSAVFEKSRNRTHVFECVFTAYRFFHSNLGFLEVVPDYMQIHAILGGPLT